jgi:truncated hemoglobin YjbI
MADVDVKISMFERIGGVVIIDRLVEAFYERWIR